MEWNPNPEKKDKVIVLTKSFELNNREMWEQAIDWLVDKTLSFRKIFGALIKERRK